MDVAAQVSVFSDAFVAAGSAKRAEGEKAYLKSNLDFFGLTVPAIQSAAKSFCREHPDLCRVDLLALVDALWTTRWYELRHLGVVLLQRYPELLRSGDIRFVEDLLRRSHTWALADPLAAAVAGDLVLRFADARRVLSRWARDECFWVRRSALLALLGPLRAGGGDFALFARFAEPMLEEKEFFIRKAIGWVLREVGKKRPALTIGFLEEHLDRVSGLTLREGARRLPDADRRSLIARFEERKRERRAGATPNRR